MLRRFRPRGNLRGKKGKRERAAFSERRGRLLLRIIHGFLAGGVRIISAIFSRSRKRERARRADIAAVARAAMNSQGRLARTAELPSRPDAGHRDQRESPTNRPFDRRVGRTPGNPVQDGGLVSLRGRPSPLPRKSSLATSRIPSHIPWIAGIIPRRIQSAPRTRGNADACGRRRRKRPGGFHSLYRRGGMILRVTGRRIRPGLSTDPGKERCRPRPGFGGGLPRDHRAARANPRPERSEEGSLKMNPSPADSKDQAFAACQLGRTSIAGAESISFDRILTVSSK